MLMIPDTVQLPISAGVGYVCASKASGEEYHVVSVIGDGALTGGMAYEALK